MGLKAKQIARYFKRKDGRNRTTVGLKVTTAGNLHIIHNSRNRTTVGLKVRLGFLLKQEFKSQSHHSGIESDARLKRLIKRFGRNRTTVGLKESHYR